MIGLTMTTLFVLVATFLGGYALGVEDTRKQLLGDDE